MAKEKNYQYTAVFEPDHESGGFVVTIPSLPGCISEGENFEKALKNIKEAASLYLETGEFGIDDSGVVISSVNIQV